MPAPLRPGPDRRLAPWHGLRRVRMTSLTCRTWAALSLAKLCKPAKLAAFPLPFPAPLARRPASFPDALSDRRALRCAVSFAAARASDRAGSTATAAVDEGNHLQPSNDGHLPPKTRGRNSPPHRAA